MNPRNLTDIVGKEDIALFLIILGVIGAVWFMGGGETSSYTPTEFCKQAAQESQANLSAKFRQVSCECVSPAQFRRLSTPQKVENVTDYQDVLVCDIGRLDRKLIFPLLKVNETKYDQYNQTQFNDTQIIQDGKRKTIPS